VISYNRRYEDSAIEFPNFFCRGRPGALIALVICYEDWGHFVNPHPVNETLMMAVAVRRL